MAGGPGDRKAGVMGSSSVMKKEMDGPCQSFMWGNQSPGKSGGFV